MDYNFCPDLSSGTFPWSQVQGASGASGASPRRAAPGFFGDADAFDAFGAEVWASRGWMEG